MEELETRYESVYFASPSAQQLVEYDYNRMRNVVQDDRNMFYRWNFLLHSRHSFFPGDEKNPLSTKPCRSAGSEVRDAPVAVMQKVLCRFVGMHRFAGQWVANAFVAL
ncbi:hypothetical protein V1506DRAFT_507563 [Lipomyces tetrasporus]